MPAKFQTCVLVSALLACGANAQIFFNLETNEFSTDRKPKSNQEEGDRLHWHPVNTHQHDTDDYRKLEE